MKNGMKELVSPRKNLGLLHRPAEPRRRVQVELSFLGQDPVGDEQISHDGDGQVVRLFIPFFEIGRGLHVRSEMNVRLEGLMSFKAPALCRDEIVELEGVCPALELSDVYLSLGHANRGQTKGVRIPRRQLDGDVLIPSCHGPKVVRSLDGCPPADELRCASEKYRMFWPLEKGIDHFLGG